MSVNILPACGRESVWRRKGQQGWTCRQCGPPKPGTPNLEFKEGDGNPYSPTDAT
jgi:ribosomal protein L37AE/L43A